MRSLALAFFLCASSAMAQVAAGNTSIQGRAVLGSLVTSDSTVLGLNEFNQNFSESANVLDAMQLVFSQFEQRPSLPDAAADVCSVAYNGSIYTFGGYGANATTYLNYTQIYHSATNSFTAGATMPTAAWGMGCAVVGSDVWLFGGATSATGQTGTTLVQVYHIASDTWDTTKTQLPVALPDGVMATTVGADIYIQWESTFLQLDPTGSGSYSTLTSPPSACQVQWGANGYLQVSGDDRIYVAGGSTGSSSGYSNETCYYSIANGWTSGLATAPYSAHGMLRNAVYGGSLYYVGGYDGTLFYDTLYSYNPSSNTWSSALAALSNWRDGVGGGFLGTTLFVMGGRNAGNSSSPFGLVIDESFAIGSTQSAQNFTTIQLNYNSGSSGNVELGVYADTGSGPGSLILDAGSVSIGGGWRSIAGLNLSLTPGTRYWLAFVQNSGQPVSYTGGTPLGTNSSGAHCFVSQTYGALPSTFPSGATCGKTSMYAEKLTVN